MSVPSPAALSTFLASVARGGLMFMIVIWLQGIWLPQHGYDFAETPLWAGISMVPLIIGMLFVGPLAGYLSDRFGARLLASTGMVLSATGFALFMTLPTDFAYPSFGAILLLLGASMGMFVSSNRAAVMNSLPAEDRGAGGAMNQAFQNSAQVLSIGIFFTPMIVGLAATLPQTPEAGLQAHGVPPATAHEVAGLPPISILFATFLGENPIVSVVDPSVLAGLSPHDQAALTGNSFFPGDLGAVPRWPARRLHLRDRGLPHRRSHLLDAGARRLRRPRAAISPRVPAVAPERSAG